MTLGKRLTGSIAAATSALVVAGPAGAAGIHVVRDVGSRNALVPATSIQVVRDIGARPALAGRPSVAIKVVRDTPARDFARAAKRGAAAITYFWTVEHSRG
jgi:hypothetical protein